MILLARLKDYEKNEVKINKERNRYRPLAARGAILYFVITSLADINDGYQYSLKYFKQVDKYTFFIIFIITSFKTGK